MTQFFQVGREGSVGVLAGAGRLVRGGMGPILLQHAPGRTRQRFGVRDDGRNWRRYRAGYRELGARAERYFTLEAEDPSSGDTAAVEGVAASVSCPAHPSDASVSGLRDDKPSMWQIDGYTTVTQ